MPIDPGEQNGTIAGAKIQKGYRLPAQTATKSIHY
jgi:hypothetical protein